MWLKEILQNKSTVILIIIIILILVLLYLNNTKGATNTASTQEKFQVENPILQQYKREYLTPVDNQTVPVATSDDKSQFKVFYTNWCGWSKRALATLNSDDFKTKFNEVKDKADLVLVDCEGTGKAECASRQINGYPTMQLIKGDKSIDFNGDRTADGIVGFIKQNC
jgi:hypothetical protein